MSYSTLQVNLAAAEVVCHNCVNSDQPVCANCGEKKVYFFGVNALDEFAKWLFDDRKGEWTAFAHNFSCLDSRGCIILVDIIFVFKFWLKDSTS